MDIALYLNMLPNLFAVSKCDLGNRDEAVSKFNNPALFAFERRFELTPESDSAVIHRKPVTLQYDATFDVVVWKLFYIYVLYVALKSLHLWDSC